MLNFAEKAKKNWSYCLVGAILFCWLIFVLIRGEGMYAFVWDNLDGAVPQLKMLGDNNLFFSWNGQIPFLNGLPRKYLYFSEFQLYNLLYAVFPAFVAYQAAWFLRPVITISGSIFFAKSISKDKAEKYKHIIVLAAFVYSWMPVIPMQSFAIVSIPWFLGFAYNFYKRPCFKYGLGIFLFPILSDMNRIGIFLCGYTLLFFIIEAIATKKPKWHMALAVIILALGYFACEWRIVYIMFSGLETNRNSYVLANGGFGHAVHQAKAFFNQGPVHAMTLQGFVIMPFCKIVFVVSNLIAIIRKDVKALLNNRLNWVLLVLLINYGVTIFDEYAVTKNWLAGLVPVLGGITLANVTWLNPCLWTIGFVIALCLAYKYIGKRVYIFCIAAMLVIPLTATDASYYNDIGINVRGLVYEIRTGKTYDNLFTFEEYYGTKLFEKVLDDIDYQGEYSYAFCIEPSVLEYNQIKTVDGNCNFYPAKYKDVWRRLIADVLEVRPDYKSAFETKGIYLFLFSPDINHEAAKDIGITKSKLMVDKDTLYELGGRYIFSRVEIENADELDLQFVNKYTDASTPYEILVYELKQ